jgi:hypothetical protein
LSFSFCFPILAINFQITSLQFWGKLSHYIDEEPDEDDDFSAGYEDMTVDVVRKHLAEEYMKTPFFKNTGLLFYPEDCYKIWKEVSFANVIQIGLSNAKSQPGDKEINTIAPAFNLLLNGLKPEKVIILSKRMWNRWIPGDNGQFVSHIVENGKRSTIWQYDYAGGKCLAVGIAHPSWMFGESCYKWKPLVDKFLSMPMNKE